MMLRRLHRKLTLCRFASKSYLENILMDVHLFLRRKRKNKWTSEDIFRNTILTQSGKEWVSYVACVISVRCFFKESVQKSKLLPMYSPLGLGALRASLKCQNGIFQPFFTQKKLKYWGGIFKIKADTINPFYHFIGIFTKIKNQIH
jgi:hypothetical protein